MAVVGPVVGAAPRRRGAPPPLVRLLVLVNGHPGAGKSTLSADLGRELDAAVLAKDAIKERLFDEVGIGDRAWSKRLGAAAMLVLHDIVAAVLPRASLIVEAPFVPELDTPRFRDALAASGAACAQVLLELPAAEIVRRMAQRMAEGSRHPGHLDHVLIAEVAGYADRPVRALELPGPVIRVDGRDVDPAAVAAAVRAAVA